MQAVIDKFEEKYEGLDTLADMWGKVGESLMSHAYENTLLMAMRCTQQAGPCR